MSYGYTIVQELPRGLDIHNFPVAFNGHYYYIFSLSDLCLEIEKKIFKEISVYDLYGHALAQEPLSQGS